MARELYASGIDLLLQGRGEMIRDRHYDDYPASSVPRNSKVILYSKSMNDLLVLRHIVADLLVAHSNGIIHGDIKIDNLGFHITECKPMILDWDNGVLNVPPDGKVPTNPMRHNRDWTAKEVMRDGYMTFKSDIYSLGLLMMSVISSQKRFVSLSEFKRGYRKNVFLEIIQECLLDDPAQRPSCLQVMNYLMNISGYSMRKGNVPWILEESSNDWFQRHTAKLLRRFVTPTYDDDWDIPVQASCDFGKALRTGERNYSNDRRKLFCLAAFGDYACAVCWKLMRPKDTQVNQMFMAFNRAIAGHSEIRTDGTFGYLLLRDVCSIWNGISLPYHYCIQDLCTDIMKIEQPSSSLFRMAHGTLLMAGNNRAEGLAKMLGAVDMFPTLCRFWFPVFIEDRSLPPLIKMGKIVMLISHSQQIGRIKLRRMYRSHERRVLYEAQPVPCPYFSSEAPADPLHFCLTSAETAETTTELSPLPEALKSCEHSLLSLYSQTLLPDHLNIARVSFEALPGVTVSEDHYLEMVEIEIARVLSIEEVVVEAVECSFFALVCRPETYFLTLEQIKTFGFPNLVKRLSTAKTKYPSQTYVPNLRVLDTSRFTLVMAGKHGNFSSRLFKDFYATRIFVKRERPNIFHYSQLLPVTDYMSFEDGMWVNMICQ